VTELAFHVERAHAVEHAAVPELAFTVGIAAAARQVVESVLLRSTVRIEAGRRPYSEAERERLRELFGSDSVWARSPKSLVWAQTTTLVPAFEGQTSTDVKVPCSYDFAASASRYIQALDGGEVPITLQFSGTVLHREDDRVQATQIPWDRESPFRLPVSLLRQVVDAHFPNAAVLGLRRDLFERLHDYRRKLGLKSTDEAVERLLAALGEVST
jgi:hypothetical protein